MVMSVRRMMCTLRFGVRVVRILCGISLRVLGVLLRVLSVFPDILLGILRRIL